MEIEVANVDAELPQKRAGELRRASREHHSYADSFRGQTLRERDELLFHGAALLCIEVEDEPDSALHCASKTTVRPMPQPTS